MNIAKYNNQLIKMYEETINKQYNAQNQVKNNYVFHLHFSCVCPTSYRRGYLGSSLPHRMS